jgi:uncharacterized protein YerC
VNLGIKYYLARSTFLNAKVTYESRTMNKIETSTDLLTLTTGYLSSCFEHGLGAFDACRLMPAKVS